MKKQTIGQIGGGATLLTACSASFGGAVWEKLLRYYDTKALRSNSRVSKLQKSGQRTGHWRNLSCHPEALAEGSQKVNEKLKQVQHDKNFGRICKVQDAKYVSEAHRKHLFPYSPITLFTSKKAAFTLAEVLITLGIIGVVAAMTIPTLIANYQEKQTVSKLQKVYATLKNALEMAKVDNGDYDTWSWNQIPQSDSKRIQYFWETYGFPYLKVAKKCFPDTDPCRSSFKINDTSEFNPDQNNGAFILNDGTSVFSWAGGDAYFQHVWMYVDINGDAKPNEMGKDIFVMYFSPNNPGNKLGSLDDDGNFVDSGRVIEYGYGLTFYGEANGVTVDDMLDPNFIMQSTTGANNNISCTRAGKRQTCAAAIKLNNWKIPDGYLE